jgi:hypothetical protein
MQDWNVMHALVRDASSAVLISPVCVDALSIGLCTRSGHPVRSVNAFSCLPCTWDVKAEVRTQISVSVSYCMLF